MIRPKIHVRKKDTGLRAFKKRIQRTRDRTVTVGVHGDSGDHEGVSVLELAMIHEFGLGNMPPRSFIRAWAEENKEEINSESKKLAQRVVKGMPLDQALGQLGTWAVGSIQKRMAEGIDPESLVDGRTIHLIDTGQLRSSITHKVE